MQLFYSNPNRSFYVREITRKIDEQINSVRRELANLLSIGIISSDTNNNRLYYEVNQQYDYYDPLVTIFGTKTATSSKSTEKTKTATPVKETAEAHEIKTIGNVELALFTGQFTRDEKSGIDLLIVGDINQTKLAKYIEDLETKESKEVRFTVMPKQEFDYRNQVKDRFLANVLTSKSQIVVDKHQLVQPAQGKKAK